METKEDFNVDELYTLASRCRVKMREACRRKGMSPTTPSRWRHERRKPQERKFNALRDAIIEIAAERGTLPEPLTSASDARSISPSDLVRLDIAGIRQALARIEERIERG